MNLLVSIKDYFFGWRTTSPEEYQAKSLQRLAQIQKLPPVERREAMRREYLPRQFSARFGGNEELWLDKYGF